MRVAFIAGFFVLAACGGEDLQPGDPAMCLMGDDCVCTQQSCSCSQDCQADCGGGACKLTCNNNAKCEGSAIQALTLECYNNSKCRGSGGAKSNIMCLDNSECGRVQQVERPAEPMTVGDLSTVTCADDAECVFTLGTGSAAHCTGKADCYFTCVGDCTVRCEGTGEFCETTCPGGALPKSCGNSKYACGPC
ncbi:MAG: hypothetical protein KF773_10955 [Deltaproteobacteria bacterium]|nr:hypothetical protein [Deltaproteobacteria bacterium]MCW5801533.1 hypothetical protein [Deltaproteobacteria bacterium]